jgi:ABC-type molybdate transport system permease subunit
MVSFASAMSIGFWVVFWLMVLPLVLGGLFVLVGAVISFFQGERRDR